MSDQSSWFLQHFKISVSLVLSAGNAHVYVWGDYDAASRTHGGGPWRAHVQRAAHVRPRLEPHH